MSLLNEDGPHLNNSSDRRSRNKGPSNDGLVAGTQHENPAKGQLIMYVAAKQLLGVHQVVGGNLVLGPTELYCSKHLRDIK
jgi:hypothetical protein